MANIVTAYKTDLPASEVITRAIQYFTGQKWQPLTQSEKIVTFKGRPAVSGCLIVLTVIAFFAFIIPGIILYLLLIRQAMAYQNLIVATSTVDNGTQVTITYPKQAQKLVDSFIALLPACK